MKLNIRKYDNLRSMSAIAFIDIDTNQPQFGTRHVTLDWEYSVLHLNGNT